jgi:hypothetical protein
MSRLAAGEGWPTRVSTGSRVELPPHPPAAVRARLLRLRGARQDGMHARWRRARGVVRGLTFYFQPPRSSGPGAEVRKPPTSRMPRLRARVAVIGPDQEIAASPSTIGARDLRDAMTGQPGQRRDLRDPLGPWLVTADEVLPPTPGRPRGHGDRQRRGPTRPRPGPSTSLVGPRRPRRPGRACSRRRARVGNAEPRLPARARPAPGRPVPEPGDTVALEAGCSVGWRTGSCEPPYVSRRYETSRRSKKAHTTAATAASRPNRARPPRRRRGPPRPRR